MPPNLRYDFAINGKGFMLARVQGGRAWTRKGVSDSLSTQRRIARSVYSSEQEYGGLPDELDHPEVHDDWSGGFGDYYYRPEHANHYHAGYNIDTRFPGMWFHAQKPQMLAARYASMANMIEGFLDLPVRNTPAGAGKVCVFGQQMMAYLTPTKYPYSAGSAFDATWNNNADVRAYGHKAVVVASYFYLPQSAPSLSGNGGAAMIQVSGAETEGFNGSFGPVPARWFEVANGRMWRGHSNNLVQSCDVAANPMVTANWSATISLSNANSQSVTAQALENRLFVGFPDGLYMGDQTGTFSNVLTDIGFNTNTENVRDTTVHLGQVVTCEGPHIWAYKPSTGANSVLRQIWPRTDVRPLATLGATPAGQKGLSFRGQITCVKGFGRWLYAGLFNGSQSMVFCGLDASYPLPYVWHPMQLFPETVKVTRLHVDAVTAASDGTKIPRRIWVATDASFGSQTGCTAPLYYWPIPDDDGPPFADMTFSSNPCTDAVLEESERNWLNPSSWKVWRKLEAYADGVGSAGIPLQVKAIVDATMTATMDTGGQFFASGNSALGSSTKDFHYFTNADNDAVGQAARFTFLSSASGGPTPVWRSFVERGVVRSRSADIIEAKVRIADGIRDRMGGTMRPGKAMMADLRAFGKSSNPFPLVDLTGATVPVTVSAAIDEEETYQVGDENPEIIATIRMAVPDASWSTAIATELHPGGG